MLICGFFEDTNAILLNTTGMLQGSMKQQIDKYMEQISEIFYHGAQLKSCKNCNETFKILNDAIKAVSSNKKVILL